MFRRSVAGWTAVAIVLTAWVGIAARGADDAPDKASKPAEKAPKSADETPSAAGEEPTTPEGVLSARGLVRSGARYVLEKQEAECFEKFEEIRPRYQDLESSYNKLAAAVMNEAQVAELQAEQAMIQQQMQMLSSSGNSMSRYSGRYGGRYSRYAQNPSAQMQQQLRAQQSVIAQQLAMAKKAVPAKQKQEATASYSKDRTALLDSSAEVREVFEKLLKEYSDVEAEPPVRTALSALRRSAKAQLKIAPSAEFERKLAQLKKLERMMRPESASQAYSTKGKSKSKRTLKSKR